MIASRESGPQIYLHLNLRLTRRLIDTIEVLSICELRIKGEVDVSPGVDSVNHPCKLLKHTPFDGEDKTVSTENVLSFEDVDGDSSGIPLRHGGSTHTSKDPVPL